MSGQWEVVGKKKDRGSKLPLPNKANNNNKDVKKKNNVLNGVKLEEVLPKSQVQSLYANNKINNKENKKPQEKPKPQDNSNKKGQKKVEKPQEPAKPKPPKSIESALNLINVQEFVSIYETSKNQFPEAPIVWLKELAQYLNLKVPIEVQDPVFTSRPENYPLSVVPSDIKNVIVKAVKEAGKSNAQLFFDIALTSMATDMGKGLSALGHKFFLQYIALNEPQLVVANINKHVNLRNSYQNRQNIGLSILWAVGHTGLSDFHVGITVFRELMLPLIEMKSYSRFIANYLLRLVAHNNSSSVTKEEYLLVLDTIYSNKKNFPLDVRQDLSKSLSSLLLLLFSKNSKEKYHSSVDMLLKKLVSNTNTSYQTCLCEMLVEIFGRDHTTLANWNKSYQKNVAASAIVLDYISNNYKTVGNKMHKGALKEFLQNVKLTNDELSLKKRKEDGLSQAIAAVQKINQKMVSKPKSSFPFKTLSFLIALIIAGVVYFDIKEQGSWKDSKTRRVLVDLGLCEYAHKALDQAKIGVTWVDARIEENFPGYHKKVGAFTEPYVQLLRDLGIIVYNLGVNAKEAVVAKYPAVVQSIESYAPGLIEQSQKAVGNVWSTSVLYFSRSVDYLKTEVFVGQLSPENMQRVVIEAFNTTQQKATEYYHWIYEKVQTSIK